MNTQQLQEDNEQLRQQNAHLLATIAELRTKLADPEEFVRAISRGEVDALVVQEGTKREEIYSLQRFATLQEKEERFRLMVEGVKDYAIYTLNPDGRVSYWNSGAMHIYGYTTEEIIGQDCSRFFTPDDVASGLLRRGMQTAIASGHLAEETWQVRKDGSRFWASGTLNALLDTAGGTRGFVKVVRDLTERKRSETLLSAVSNSVMDGIIGITERGDIETFNKGAENLFGYAGAEVIGRNIKVLMPEPYQSEHDGYLDHYLRTGEAKVIGIGRHIEARRKDGSTFPIHLTVSEFFLEAVRHFTGVVRDTTEERRAESDLQEAEIRLGIAVKAANIGLWDWNLTTSKVQFSPEWKSQIGFADHEIGNELEEWRSRVHPDDLARAVEIVQQFLANPTGLYQTEFRLRHRDGSYRWIFAQGSVIGSDPGSARRFIGSHIDITERKRAEEVLHLRDRAMQAVSQGILITDPNQPDNPIIYVNPAAERMTGYGSEELLGRNCRFLQGAQSDPEVVAEVQEAIRAGHECSVEILNYRKDGTPFWNALFITPVRDEKGRLLHFVGVQADVTDRRNLEEQVRQSQKMEAVGQLAGGVAHDFNNLLTIISGYSEILLSTLESDDPMRESVKAISEAGSRAASLTRQLLAFSRKTVQEPKVLDLNDVVRETEKMLRRLIGEDIILTAVLDPKINRVKVDPGQLDQVLMNLSVNARDAMPKGGKLTLETRNIELDENYAHAHAEVRAGQYVMLAVTDSGFGMTDEIKSHIFEPFFTTKGVGKGTGLGLAVVHGIVKQSGGHIGVYSELNRGTTFKLYFPAIKEKALAKVGAEKGEVRGNETILLVEDEDGVRGLALLVLQMHGYKVLAASDGKQALRVVESHKGAIDLLVTDVVMPGMDGGELASILKPRLPQMKVLFASGYTDDSVIRHGILEAEVAFIQKPYSPQALARKVRQVLDNQ